MDKRREESILICAKAGAAINISEMASANTIVPANLRHRTVVTARSAEAWPIEVSFAACCAALPLAVGSITVSEDQVRGSLQCASSPLLTTRCGRPSYQFSGCLLWDGPAVHPQPSRKNANIDADANTIRKTIHISMTPSSSPGKRTVLSTCTVP
jgi:hypothetical protein